MKSSQPHECLVILLSSGSSTALTDREEGSYLRKWPSLLKFSSDLSLLVFPEVQPFELQTMPLSTSSPPLPQPEQCAELK